MMTFFLVCFPPSHIGTNTSASATRTRTSNSANTSTHTEPIVAKISTLSLMHTTGRSLPGWKFLVEIL